MLHLPVGAGGPESSKPFIGLIDLVKMKALIWRDEELGAKWDEVDIPADMADEANQYREELIETIATSDDELMEKYLGGEDLTEAEIKRAIRKGTLAFDFVPILCGSAFKNKGVQPMLDAVIDFLPSPLDIPPTTGVRRTTKTRSSPARPPRERAVLRPRVQDRGRPVRQAHLLPGLLGQINKGDEVYNSTKERKERLGRILLMHANQREDLDVAMAGDIVAGLGFKTVTTGDTLCDPANPIILERMEFPEPVIHVAIEPKTKDDQEKLGKALKSLSDEDPTFRVRTDEETGQTVISGMGELHLEILVDRMMREFNVVATVGKPQVAYRETITKSVDTVEYRHIKQTGGTGQFAVVKISLEPNPGKGYEFVDKISGGRIPREYIQPTNQGIQAALESGVLAGYPTVDVKAILVDGAVPRRRLLGNGVQDRRSAGVQEGRRDGQAGAPRADHGRRGRHPRRVHGRRHGRPVEPPRPDRGHGGQRQQPGGPGPGSAVGDVRLQYRPPVAHPGACDLHDAVPLLPGSAGRHRERHHQARSRRVIAAPTHSR